MDEATTRVIEVGGVRLRLLGLGGAVVVAKMFDNGEGSATIAGGGGTMWTTALQMGELLDTAQRVSPVSIRGRDGRRRREESLVVSPREQKLTTIPFSSSTTTGLRSLRDSTPHHSLLNREGTSAFSTLPGSQSRSHHQRVSSLPIRSLLQRVLGSRRGRNRLVG